MLNIPEDYIKRKTSTIPFGYEESDIKGYLSPNREQLKNLELVVDMLETESISLREGTLYLEQETGRRISPMGLKKLKDKRNALQ